MTCTLVARGLDGESARMRTRGFERSRGREERRDSDVRDLVKRSPISPGQRRRWNSSNRRISYHKRATTLDIQHLRSPTLASHRHNGIIIADAAKDRPLRLISCGEAERHRKVREGGSGSSSTCVGRGI
jgi:hypothetical protein